MPNGGWWLRAGGYVFHVTKRGESWAWDICLDVPMVANGVANGEQAAANAATRWLVKRAELTLKLASRRAA
jgi:hypothetical protein